ncbi:hypothetical protein H671_2g7673 [Cricetulus griseus]|nr:hypothetical protein H671_2g7673 [Cricetulus griseus]
MGSEAMVQAALAERSRIMVAILKLVLVGTRHLGEVLDLAIDHSLPAQASSEQVDRSFCVYYTEFSFIQFEVA